MLRSVRERLRNRRRKPNVAEVDSPKQPRIFRNRSLDYPPLHRRWFNRSRKPAAAQNDRATPIPPPQEASQRNEDSFSSLPSTHASRDPFLNDDVPVEISRLPPREDRPRVTQEAGLGSRMVHSESPPISISSTGTTKKRSSLWKRSYDPEAVQSSHERDILKAVQLCEVSSKDKSVIAAEQLVSLVDSQVRNLSDVLEDVSHRLSSAKGIAGSLPSSRDARYHSLLYSSNSMNTGTDTERIFLELHWTERVWDLEALLAEKRYEDCVASVEKIEADGLSSNAQRPGSKFHSLRGQLVQEMSALCVIDAPTAAVFAPLLQRLGVADEARNVVLDGAHLELKDELTQLSNSGIEAGPRLTNMMLDRAVMTFRKAHKAFVEISARDSSSSSFVSWIAEQSDFVYTNFLSSVLRRLQKNDPITTLKTIESIRHRRSIMDEPLQRDEKSLVALMELRMKTNLRSELERPIVDAEKQLTQRTIMYASAIPSHWKDGPYQSGRALCDDLNALSRSIEGALMDLSPEADALIGNLIARPALMYCGTLLEMGTRAVREQNNISLSEVQEGLFKTFVVVGKTLFRINQKLVKVPHLERVSAVLMAPSIAEIRALQSEMVKGKSARTSGDTLSPKKGKKKDEELRGRFPLHVPARSGYGSSLNLPQPPSNSQKGSFTLMPCPEIGNYRDMKSSYEDVARSLLTQQRIRVQ